MKVKDLIEVLSKMDPNLICVTNVDKYNTHKLVSHVTSGFYDDKSNTFIEKDDQDSLEPEAVSICD